MATPAATSKAKQPAGLAAVLRSSGPIVTAVLLEISPTKTEESTKRAATATDEDAPPIVLSHLIREVRVDTTPSNNGAAAALGGGPITFLGQFPDEGCVVIARQESTTTTAVVTDYRSCSLSELREHCKERKVDMTGMVEKQDLIDALEQRHSGTADMNPHIPLPPPLHKVRDVRGPILLLRVAATEEEEPMLENDDEEEAATLQRAVAEFERASAVSNDDFFLNYTKDEYVKFASRTDHVIPSSSSEEEEEHDDEEVEGTCDGGDDDDDEDSDDDDFDPSEASEDEKRLLMNFIFSEVLEQFREQNGRGPDSDEVLELRKSVAQKLGMQLPEPIPPAEPKKRPADAAAGKAAKRVKFDGSVVQKDDDDKEEPHSVNKGDDDDQPHGNDDRKQPGTQEAEGTEDPSAE